MKRWSLVFVLVLAQLLPLAAQQMSVEGFSRLKRPFWNPKSVTLDKGCALMDFVTEEKGFEFLANGNKAAEVEEGDGIITVKMPHRTTWAAIQHPEFGHLAWKVPGGKHLKRNRHYRAYLFAGNPAQDYKPSSQWVVFHLSPADVLLQVDSIIKPVRSDVVEYYLPVGTHSYRAEAPFYEVEEGSFNLSDSARMDIALNLQPFFSFLTVKFQGPEGDLYVDNNPVSKEEATSMRLGEGYHRVAVFWGERCFYDSLLFVAKAEKKVLELTGKDMYPRDLRKTDPVPVNPPKSLENGEQPLRGSVVKLFSADPEAEIWLDRECVGKGQWEGWLPQGFHMVSTLKDGVESEPTSVWVEDDFPQEITLKASGIGVGLLNIHCNVSGAGIDIDGTDYGEAPRIVRLDASRRYKVTLSKDGYKSTSRKVAPRGNHMVEVYMKLKKKRI